MPDVAVRGWRLRSETRDPASVRRIANGSRTVNSTNDFQTIHGSFYGFYWSPYHVQKCDDGPLEHIEFHFNALQLAATVTTLGLYVPQTVEWWCDDPNSVVDDGDEPEPDPGGEFGATAAAPLPEEGADS